MGVGVCWAYKQCNRHQPKNWAPWGKKYAINNLNLHPSYPCQFKLLNCAVRRIFHTRQCVNSYCTFFLLNFFKIVHGHEIISRDHKCVMCKLLSSASVTAVISKKFIGKEWQNLNSLYLQPTKLLAK